MDQLIKQLRTLPYRFNPPVTDAEFKELERGVACELPAEIVQLYRDHNGAGRDWSVFSPRLMSIQEVLDFQKYVESERWNGLGARFFWTDDNSNHVGVYVEGPLTGRCCYIDHEDTDLSPVFRSVGSCVKEMYLASLADEKADSGWRDAFEYPITASSTATDDEKAADWRVAQLFRDQLARCNFEILQGKESREYHWSLKCLENPRAVPNLTFMDRFYLARTFLKLTPPERTAETEYLLGHPDMFVRADACSLAGKHKNERVTTKLAEIGVSGKHNDRLSALRALGDIGTTQAADRLLAVASKVDRPWGDHIISALHYGCGCEIEPEFPRGSDAVKVRIPGENEWRTLFKESQG